MDKPLRELARWAVPPFHEKERLTWFKLWILATPLPLLLLQIHLLLRYEVKRTWLLRASLIPFVTLLALRAGFSHYAQMYGTGQLDGGLQHVNMTFAIFAVFMILCSIRYGLTLQQPQLKTGTSFSKQNGERDTRLPTFFPGSSIPLELDYFVNLRGLGWVDGLKGSAPALPLPLSPTRSQRIKWVLDRALSLVLQATLLDVVFALMKDARFNPTIALPTGGSIWECRQGSFGWAGPYLLCVCYALALYTSIQAGGCMGGILGVGVLGQVPERWDPLPFSAPWLATSLQQLWSDRWHQLFRITFLDLGYWPTCSLLRPYVGRRAAQMAGVMAVFGLSGLIHDLGQSAMTPDQSFFSLTRVSVFFIAHGVATITEQAWQSVTGFRVHGVGGWMWAMTWSLLTAPLLIESWNMKGMLNSHDVSLGYTRPAVHAFLDMWHSIEPRK